MIAATTLSSLWSNTEPSTSTGSGKEILLSTNKYPWNRLGWEGEGEVRVSSGLWAEKNPVKCCGSGVKEKVRRQLRVLAGDGALGSPDAMLPGALTALPGFLSADLSGAAPGPRLEARSKSRSRTPRIKSISPRASAKFHQSPGRTPKGRLLGDVGDAAPAEPLTGVSRRRTEGAGPGGVQTGRTAAGRSACWSEAGCERQGFSGGRGRLRKPTGRDWLAAGGREEGSTRPGMELQSSGSERGRP